MPDRTREILEDLEAVRENLLALSDDIWQSIDHNDPEGLEEGVRFKRAYNEKMAAFDTLASELSAMIQQFTSVRLEEHEDIGGDDESRNVRIIQAPTGVDSGGNRMHQTKSVPWRPSAHGPPKDRLYWRSPRRSRPSSTPSVIR